MISVEIYLDSAATTKPDVQVLNAMTQYLSDEYGNAGSVYRKGRIAFQAISNARKQVSKLIGCDPDNIIFTSGGSEANSMVFGGLRRRLTDAGKKHLIVSAVEHDSVLKSVESLIKDGFYVTFINPDTSGVIRAEKIESAIRPDTGLVSVMYVNNETGVANDIGAIGRMCRAHSILFHSDCVQALGAYEVSPEKNCVDYASFSSHKIHGVKGVGALYIRDKNISPIIFGGDNQEFGLRGGTENVAGIVGFGTACELATMEKNDFEQKFSTLKQLFYSSLIKELEQNEIESNCVKVNGASVVTPGKIINITIDGVDAETLLLMLEANNVFISAGSACQSKVQKPSHVLVAMGLTQEEAKSSVRISFCKFNTYSEVQEAAKILALCIADLKRNIR